MRLLIVGANASTVGGCETYQRSLAPMLVGAGHDVRFLHERDTVPGIPRVADGADTQAWFVASMGESHSLDAIAGWKPDALYVQELTSPALEAKLVARYPAVLFAHSYYGTCATGSKRHTRPSLRFCERKLGPACLPLNYLRGCGARRPSTLLASYRRQRAHLAAFADYRAVCVASEHMRREFRRHGVPETRLHVLHLPPSGITPLPDAPPPPTRSGRVLLSGRLTSFKGAAMAARAVGEASARLNRPLTLVVSGDGPERSGMEREANRCGVPVEWKGWLDVDARNALLQTVDLVLMPSLWPEPWGLVGIEAACVGVPTAAFHSGGITEWLAPGESGEVAPANPPTAAGFAAAIVRALQDGDHYAKLSRNAWERSRTLTYQSHVERLVPILEAAYRS